MILTLSYILLFAVTVILFTERFTLNKESTNARLAIVNLPFSMDLTGTSPWCTWIVALLNALSANAREDLTLSRSRVRISVECVSSRSLIVVVTSEAYISLRQFNVHAYAAQRLWWTRTSIPVYRSRPC